MRMWWFHVSESLLADSTKAVENFSPVPPQITKATIFFEHGSTTVEMASINYISIVHIGLSGSLCNCTLIIFLERWVYIIAEALIGTIYASVLINCIIVCKIYFPQLYLSARISWLSSGNIFYSRRVGRYLSQLWASFSDYIRISDCTEGSCTRLSRCTMKYSSTDYTHRWK